MKRTITRTVDHADTGPCPYKGWDQTYNRIHLVPMKNVQLSVV